jgi:hypothetical protein
MSDLTIPAAKVCKATKDSTEYAIYRLPDIFKDHYWAMVKHLEKQGVVYHKVKVGRPFKPRSTGKHSQGNHFNGHVAQLANELGYGFFTMKMYVKRQAIALGWPYETGPDGAEEPYSETDVSSEEINAGIEMCHILATQAGINLVEE